MAAVPHPQVIATPTHPRGGSNFTKFLRRLGDIVTFGSSVTGAVVMIAILLIMVVTITIGAWPAIKAFGLSFFIDSSWNPVKEHFGAWPVIYGTLVSSAIALLIAVPVSVGAAIFLVRLCPRRLVTPVSFLIELLAAIPSIAYGLWGAAVLVPILQQHVNPFIGRTLGNVPALATFFADPGAGYSLFAGGIILSIMIIPIITAVTRDVLLAAPPDLEQGAYGLGATWWQATKVVLSFSKMGIFGAVILGFARAIGETMAVTMVVGNTLSKDRSVLAPGQTIASLLANQFREADTDMFTSALVYTALLLLVITLIINAIARVMIVRVSRRAAKR